MRGSWQDAIGSREVIRVGLVQINSSFSQQHYFPYSTGLLQAYALRHLKNPSRYRFLAPVYTRLPVQEAADQLAEADIVGFSCYVWNYQISIKIAQRLKALKPEILIVFGGPHVPDRVEPFLRANPFIDIACHGEGEHVFTSLLEAVVSKDLSGVPSMSTLTKEGLLKSSPRAERLRDLSVIPSPYLSGVFDPLMTAHPDQKWIALWETNRGCPFSCTFCDWGSAVAGKVSTWDMDRLFKEYEWFARRKVEFVFCADANFGMLPRDIELAKHCADIKLKHGYPHAISIQNTKNATERSYQVQKIFSDAGLNKGVVVSLQSVDSTTLEAIRRDNISLESYYEIQRRFAARGIQTMTDLILGLPGETYESFVDGVSLVIENGQHNRIQFNNLSVLPNSEMGDPEYQKRYDMQIVETKVVNIHGELEEPVDGICETQHLVVGTKTMPKPDWVKARAFSWMTGLLHFDKVLQIPLIVVRELSGLRYRDIIEYFSEGRFGGPADFPILTELRGFFLDKAVDIQKGGREFCRSSEWLSIWWPADEYFLIKLVMEGKIDAFYAEAEAALNQLLASRRLGSPAPEVVGDCVRLNRALLKMPFQTEDIELELGHNIGEFYRSVLVGKPIAFSRKTSRYRVERTRETWDSWEDWCRKVIWYANKKGAYLYGNTPVDPKAQLAGHH